MGMNIGAILVSEKEDIVTKRFEESTALKLTEIKESTWLACSSGIRGKEIMTYEKNSSTLVYLPFDIINTLSYKTINEVIENFEKGVSFYGSETSMGFEFNFYEHGILIGKDGYLFEEEFSSFGENRLRLSEESDIIWDGFFPLVDTYLGETMDSDKVKIYTYEDKMNPVLEMINNADEKIKRLNQLNSQVKVDDGIFSIIQLFELQKEILQISPKYKDSIAKLWADKIDNPNEWIKKFLWAATLSWEEGIPAHGQQDAIRVREMATYLWAKKEINVDSIFFKEKYKKIEKILDNKLEYEPYKKLEELKSLMIDLKNSGFILLLVEDNQINSPKFVKSVTNLMHKNCKIWSKGFSQDEFLTGKSALRTVACYLSQMTIGIEPKSNWKFW